MLLVGRYTSPFSRRVAVSLCYLGFEYEHKPINAWSNLTEMRSYNPVGRVPALVLDDGEVLFDSGAILDYLDFLVGPERALTPLTEPERHGVMRVIVCAMGALEKMVHSVYEVAMHPEEKVHEPWIDHNLSQTELALTLARSDRPDTLDGGGAPHPGRHNHHGRRPVRTGALSRALSARHLCQSGRALRPRHGAAGLAGDHSLAGRCQREGEHSHRGVAFRLPRAGRCSSSTSTKRNSPSLPVITSSRRPPRRACPYRLQLGTVCSLARDFASLRHPGCVIAGAIRVTLLGGCRRAFFRPGYRGDKISVRSNRIRRQFAAPSGRSGVEDSRSPRVLHRGDGWRPTGAQVASAIEAPASARSLRRGCTGRRAVCCSGGPTI